MTTIMEREQNRVRNTFTLEKSVDYSLKHLIKPRERSEYINNLLKEDLQKKAMNGLNDRIRNLAKISPSEPSVEVLRKFREDSRFNKLITNSSNDEQK
jgi:hypothetical protein